MKFVPGAQSVLIISFGNHSVVYANPRNWRIVKMDSWETSDSDRGRGGQNLRPRPEGQSEREKNNRERRVAIGFFVNGGESIVSDVGRGMQPPPGRELALKHVKRSFRPRSHDCDAFPRECSISVTLIKNRNYLNKVVYILFERTSKKRESFLLWNSGINYAPNISCMTSIFHTFKLNNLQPHGISWDSILL